MLRAEGLRGGEGQRHRRGLPARGWFDGLGDAVDGAVGDDAGVDGDERGEAAQDAELQRGGDDGRFQVGVPGHVGVFEVAQCGTGPLGGERGFVALPHGDHGFPVAAVTGVAADGEGAGGRPAVAAREDQRDAGVERGGVPRGLRVRGEGDPVGGDGHVGDDGGADAALDVLHGLVEAVLALHQLAAARSPGGEPAEEARVDGGVDADAVDPGAADQRGDVAQDLVLVADLAVGDQHDHAVAVVVGAREQAQAVVQRGEELGATAGFHAGQVLDGAVAVAVGGLDQTGAQAGGVLDAVVEGDHGEPVVLGERVDDAGGGAAGGDHLPAAHAAGAVEQQHDVARAHGGDGLGREDGELVGALLAVGDADRRGPVAGVGKAQHEVAVGALAGQHAEVVALPRHGVQARPDLAEVETGRVDVDADGERDRVGETGQQHGRGDAGGVGHPVGVGRVAAADGLARQRGAGNVAGRDDEREAERGGVVLVDQRLDHGELHGHAFARDDVADPHGEDVGPLLLGDGRPLAGGDGLVVVLPGLPAFLQLRLDGAAVGGHGHPGHGRAVGQREHVGGLEGGVVRVDELGGQGDAGDQPGDGGAHVEAVQREVAAFGAQRADARVDGLPDAVQLGRSHRRGGEGHRESLSSVSRPRAVSRSSSGWAAVAMSR